MMVIAKRLLLFIAGIGCLSSLIVGYSHAEDFKEADMGSVGLRFCNDGTGNDELKNDLTLSVEPGSGKDLCIYFFNIGEKNIDFVYGFSEGKIGKYGEQMCEADMTTGNDFSRFIPMTSERKVSVKGQTYQIVHEKIQMPLGMSGVVYGCIAYKLESPEYKSMGGMFDLVVRRTAHINLFVGGKGTIKNTIKVYPLSGGVFTTNKKLKAVLDDDNDLKMSFLVGNEGNISQNVSITGKIYNVLGFEKTFTVDAKKLAPGEKFTFTSDIGVLPFYKGFFKVKFYVQNTPVFDFDVGGMDENLKKGGMIEENANVFMFSWAVVIILIIVLFILYRAFSPRKRQQTV